MNKTTLYYFLRAQPKNNKYLIFTNDDCTKMQVCESSNDLKPIFQLTGTREANVKSLPKHLAAMAYAHDKGLSYDDYMKSKEVKETNVKKDKPTQRITSALLQVVCKLRNIKHASSPEAEQTATKSGVKVK